MKLKFMIKSIAPNRSKHSFSSYLVYCIQESNMYYNEVVYHNDNRGNLNTDREWRPIEIKRIK
jgi:hypothetical protein